MNYTVFIFYLNFISMNFISKFVFLNFISMPLSVWPAFKFLSVFGYQYTDKKYPKMAILIKKNLWVKSWSPFFQTPIFMRKPLLSSPYFVKKRPIYRKRNFVPSVGYIKLRARKKNKG